MRKFTKSLMVLALLVIGWSGAYAQGEIDVTTLPWVNNGQGCTQDFDNDNGSTVFGTDVTGAASYVDVSAYGTIKLYGKANQTARLFINRAEDQKRSSIILRNMFNMISELGMVPLTEGIETEEQFRSLSQMGCELFQGYLFSKPMPLESFEAEYQIKAES